jgi:glycosyltransferase involved in cell wall biosynthesis
MRLLFIADGRSPIALNWIRYFIDTGHEVHLASTFACSPNLDLASLNLIDAAFSGRAGSGVSSGSSGFLASARAIQLRTKIRHGLGPLTLPAAARQLNRVIERVRPDLLHAMRIPFEGMVAAAARPQVPLLVSVWGNDFTYHARSNPLMANYTRRTVRCLTALHTDCRRDLHLAEEWGFRNSRPSIVLPGSGGVRSEYFYTPRNSEVEHSDLEDLNRLDAQQPLVVNPRGFRAYVRNDTFFKSIPLVLAEKPDTLFFCPAMAGEGQALEWLQKLNIEHAVRLLPKLHPIEMGKLFRRSQVMVSPSIHDGTPNTLLEAMACGSYPIAGDLESIREWIVDGENGSLIDAAKPENLAQKIIAVLDDPSNRQLAAKKNSEIIKERATFDREMARATGFYEQLIG